MPASRLSEQRTQNRRYKKTLRRRKEERQLTAAPFRETNPVPVKHALASFGLMSAAVHLPLVGLSDQCGAELTQVLLRMCND
jgi:dihydrodipicolinate synthase/N-acetylneuraminate lyase